MSSRGNNWKGLRRVSHIKEMYKYKGPHGDARPGIKSIGSQSIWSFRKKVSLLSGNWSLKQASVMIGKC